MRTAYTYRLVRPLTWTRAENGDVLVPDPAGRNPPLRLVAWSEHLLRGIAEGESFDDLQRRFPAGGADLDGRARRFVMNLARLGYLEVPFDPPKDPSYVLERELGRGAVGVVYLARAPDGSPAVYKVAWEFYAAIEHAEAALRREAETLRALAHPGVVRCLDAYGHDGTFRLVREFVDGEELSVVQRKGLPAREALAVAAEAAAITAHVHARGFLLRDFRPANFLRRTGDGRLVLVDVGQCTRAPDLELRLETVSGAPGFLPPETLQDGTVTARSDAWALGALLLFLHTGLVPPRRPDLAELLEAADAEVAAVAARLAAPRPEDRVGSLTEAEALLAAAASR